MKTLSVFSLGSACALITALTLGCGDKGKDEIVGEIFEPLSEQQSEQLKGLGNKKFKDLSAQEKASLADVVHDYFSNKLDLSKAGKKVCHLAAIAAKPSKASECIAAREECINKMPKKAEELKKGLPSKAEITQLLENSEITGENFKIAVSVLGDGFKLADSLECGASAEEVEKAHKNLEAEMEKKYGKEKMDEFAKLKGVIKTK